jgi:hypothetical protein
LRQETFFIISKSLVIQLLHNLELSACFKQPHFVITEDNKTWQIGCPWFQRNKWSVIIFPLVQTLFYFQQEIFSFIIIIFVHILFHSSMPEVSLLLDVRTVNVKTSEESPALLLNN